MPSSDQRPKVKIEDLLRLKRMEKPSAEFWKSFELELRQKQLAALLEKRTWWEELPRYLTRRAYLPVGATAILAFTLVSLRYYAPVQVVHLEGAAGGAPVALSTQIEPPVANQQMAPVSSPLVNRNGQTVPGIDDRVSLATDNPSKPAEPAHIALSSGSTAMGESPSAQSIAQTLARLEQSEPELINSVMGSRLSSPVRAQVSAAPAVELASLSSNGSKRSRLLASYNDRQLSPEPTAPDIVRERLSRRLGDTDYSDRFGRIGLKGSQVSLKF